MSRKSALLIGLIITAIFILSFGFGCIVATPQDLAFRSVEQVWGIILNDYVEKDEIDANQLSQAAIEGMLDLLDDPYTTYLDKESFQLSFEDLAGKFEGIGAVITVDDDDQIVVVAPIAGAPAAEAGIKPGDVLLKVDGVSTSGMGLYEVILMVRGPKGTSVSLLVLHENEAEPVEIVIIRDEIEVQSVIFEMRGEIAYIQIIEFNERTNEELLPVLEAIDAARAVGIILDLRSNPGGLLQTVVDVTSHFVNEGLIVVSIKDSEDILEELKANKQQLTSHLPMVVLVDDFSASGSEVLAGALQDHNRATIAGSKTFGKGSVNYLQQLADGSGIYISAARWLTPNGSLIEGEGIVPDIELELEGEDAIQWAVDYLKNAE
ncbi:MAG: S41 family peptidase [Dehalococcoidia bacterium]|nr:MAG: S41 family peptidase [Dehalococcoidia bacterium]